MDIILTCGIAWAIAQITKVAIRYYQLRVFDLRLLWESGGFPSAHSAFVTCLMAQIGMIEHFQGSLFALSLGFWLVVVYDSFNVRYAVGVQSQALNKLTEELNERFGEDYKPIQEILGHTPVQVIAGILLGAIIALVRIQFFPLQG